MRSAIRGKRGQAFLREMLAALDAMPEKRLVAHELVSEDGDCCAMGAVCKARGIDVQATDPDCPEEVAEIVGLADAMVREIAYVNDDQPSWKEPETPEARWIRMRAWCVAQIKGEGTVPA